MKRVDTIIILLLNLISCLTAIDSNAQQTRKEFGPDQYRAIHWSTADGLGDDRSSVVIKDVQGFLWIGINSKSELNRFDGVEFKKYIADPVKPGAFNGGQIRTLREDSLNNIWIGTENGMSRYDMRSDTFTNFVLPIDSMNADKSIIPFWATHHEIYCLESKIRIVSYDIHSLKRKVLLDKALEGIRRFNPAYIIFDSASNSFWMPAFRAEDSTKGALLNISISTVKRQNYDWLCTRIGFHHNHFSEALRFDRARNSIWLNSGDGLIEFSLKERQFLHIDALDEFTKMKDYDRWVGVELDKWGRVWFATQPKGILIYDPQSRQVRQLFSDKNLQQTTGETNFQILCARDGIVWLTCWNTKGIYALLPFGRPVIRYNAKPGVKDSLSNGRIYSIVPGPNGKLWLGTGDGLNIFDPVTEKFEVLREKDLPGIRGKAIVPLHIDTIRQIAWLNSGLPDPGSAYDMQMYEMNLQTRKCRPMVFMNGLKRIGKLVMVPAEIRPFKNGFLVEDDDHGVFEVKAGSIIAELVAPFDKSNQISKMILEDERFLFLRKYLALPNLNFEYKNGKWVKITHMLDSLQWISMLYNKKDGTHWVSLDYELVHFDKDFHKIKTYRPEDGYSAPIYNMLFDDSGNLWFINFLKKVGRLNISSGKFSMLTETDGFQDKEFDWSVPVAKNPGGNLYFGTGFDIISGVKGLDRIYPERYTSSNTSIVYLRALAINQKPFSGAIGLNSIEELSLDYDQNSIGIEAGIIDYYSRGKGQTRYKLEQPGKQNEWQYPKDKAIRLDGLAPGTYQLTMQASSASGEFNSPEKIILIRISPPFWETWWFRILVTIAGIGIIFGIIQYRSRNLKRKNIQLEEKVVLRTRELKQSLEELRETQTQLIQREKMASLGELTAGIAHEIQNPLNFVNNFSEVSQELIEELRLEQNKQLRDPENEKQILDNIVLNLEKINHHGKRADTIVKGMLQHSRTSTGQKEATDINQLADEYLRLSFHGLRAKDKTFNATIHTDFNPRVKKIEIIPQDIGRVFLNLYNNAFYSVTEKKNKLVKEGGNQADQIKFEPTVNVSTRLIDPTAVGGRGLVEICVRDNGMGIPQKVLDKVFQPFFTTKPTGEGTGLGLSLSYDIITKMHGGELKVDTIEGEWTEFTVQLPI